MGKLGLKDGKSTKRIKMINAKEVLTMGITQGVKLQIEKWKGKKDF